MVSQYSTDQQVVVGHHDTQQRASKHGFKQILKRSLMTKLHRVPLFLFALLVRFNPAVVVLVYSQVDRPLKPVLSEGLFSRLTETHRLCVLFPIISNQLMVRGHSWRDAIVCLHALSQKQKRANPARLNFYWQHFLITIHHPGFKRLGFSLFYIHVNQTALYFDVFCIYQ